MLLWSIQDTQKDKQLCRYVLSQKFFYCVTPMSHSKTGRNYVSSAERKSCKCQGKCQLNRASPVPPHKKNWKAMTQHESLLRELAHQTWARVFFGRLNRFMLCHCFSEHWSFFPFSRETSTYNQASNVCMCVCMYVSHVLDRKLLQRLMSPSPKSQVMFASAFSWIGDFFFEFLGFIFFKLWRVWGI